MLCTLEAYGVPTFVQGSGFGSLHPGPQIVAYNTRRIMVPDGYVAQAQDALKFFAQPLEAEVSTPPTMLNKLRVILEVLIFGWFVPGNRRQSAAVSNSSKRTREKPRAA